MWIGAQTFKVDEEEDALKLRNPFTKEKKRKGSEKA